MDHLIIDSTPKGSPMLAYGSARGIGGWNIKLPALIVGSLVVLIGVIFTSWFFMTRLSVPTQRMVMIALKPSAIDARMDPTLRRDLPPPWRAALETHSRVPALLGLSLDAQRRVHPFAVIARTSAIVGEPGLTITNQGMFRVLTDGSEIEHERTHLSDIAKSIWEIRGNDAAYSIRMDLVGELTHHLEIFKDVGDHEEISGTWNGSFGQLALAPEQQNAEPISAPMFATLGGNTETASPVIIGLLSQGVDLRSLSSAPSRLAMDPANNGTLLLEWSGGLNQADNGLLAAARGVGQRAPYALTDGTEAKEILPGTVPDGDIGSTTLFIGEKIASSTFLLPTQPGNDWVKQCQGTPIFSLNEEILHRVLDQWSVPTSWKEHLKEFRIIEQDETVHTCVRFE